MTSTSTVHRAPTAEVALRRRQVVAVITVVLGAVALTVALRSEPGSWVFVAGSLLVGTIWLVGGLLTGPVRAGGLRHPDGSPRSPVVPAALLGLLLLGIFLVGAILISRIDLLREPLDDLLAHSTRGGVLIAAAVTALTGAAEEVFFRGGLFSVIPRWPVLVSTAVYLVTTLGAGVPLLVLAALLVGLVTGQQRQVSGGVLAPTITHLTWSLGMLLLLPGVLSFADRLLG